LIESYEELNDVTGGLGELNITPNPNFKSCYDLNQHDDIYMKSNELNHQFLSKFYILNLKDIIDFPSSETNVKTNYEDMFKIYNKRLNFNEDFDEEKESYLKYNCDENENTNTYFFMSSAGSDNGECSSSYYSNSSFVPSDCESNYTI